MLVRYPQSSAYRCVSPAPIDRCTAIQELLRPEEIEHLILRVPAGWAPFIDPFASSAAVWLQNMFRQGRLSYIQDPVNCDLWCSPARTLLRRGGDCDDLSILMASLMEAGGIPAFVVTGTYFNGITHVGHAWVEGQDADGGFLLEATTGQLIRGFRPWTYSAELFLSRGQCQLAA